MTYEEACRLLGYVALPLLMAESREIVIETAIRLSENGTKPIDPGMAHLCQNQIEEFG
jgi:hypothetical protein